MGVWPWEQMKQLTGLDALFLELESPEMPMHSQPSAAMVLMRSLRWVTAAAALCNTRNSYFCKAFTSGWKPDQWDLDVSLKTASNIPAKTTQRKRIFHSRRSPRLRPPCLP